MFLIQFSDTRERAWLYVAPDLCSTTEPRRACMFPDEGHAEAQADEYRGRFTNLRFRVVPLRLDEGGNG